MEDTALVLSTCRNKSAYGIRWPTSGPIVAPEWDPKPFFGKGLIGLLWGLGRGTLLDHAGDAEWIVTEVQTIHLIDLGWCVKFACGIVIYAGNRETATRLVYDRRPGPIHGLRLVVGPEKTAHVGDWGEAVAGTNGMAVAGKWGYATVGDHGTAQVGVCGIAVAGRGGTAIADVHGFARAGEGGTASVGAQGHARAGAKGTARAGCQGTAAAGPGGTIMIQNRYDQSWITGRVGENGIRPWVPYQVFMGRLIEA